MTTTDEDGCVIGSGDTFGCEYKYTTIPALKENKGKLVLGWNLLEREGSGDVFNKRYSIKDPNPSLTERWLKQNEKGPDAELLEFLNSHQECHL